MPTGHVWTVGPSEQVNCQSKSQVTRVVGSDFPGRLTSGMRPSPHASRPANIKIGIGLDNKEAT